MTQNQKDKIIDHLRSIALTAHEMIDELRKDNFGNFKDLKEDLASDLEKIGEVIEYEPL